MTHGCWLFVYSCTVGTEFFFVFIKLMLWGSMVVLVVVMSFRSSKIFVLSYILFHTVHASSVSYVSRSTMLLIKVNKNNGSMVLNSVY